MCKRRSLLTVLMIHIIVLVSCSLEADQSVKREEPTTQHTSTTLFALDDEALVHLADRIRRIFDDEIVTTAIEGSSVILYVDSEAPRLRSYVEEIPEAPYIEVRKVPVEMTVMHQWENVVTASLLEAKLLTHIDIRETEGKLTVWVTDADRANEVLAILGIPSYIRLEVIEGAGLINQ